MKQSLLIASFLYLVSGANAQLSMSSAADSVDQVVSSACMACPGNDWFQMANTGDIDSQQGSTVLYPNPNCFQTNCFYSRHLYTHLYNFTIPGNSAILGIEVTISRMSGNTNSATDSTLKLVKTAGSYVGQNKASAVSWPVGMSTVVYGSPTDLWGTTWTPAEINDPSFGVWYNIFNAGTITTTPGIDGIEIEVYYAIAPGIIESQSASMSFGKIIWNGAGFQALLENGTQNVTVEILDLTGKQVATENHVMNGKTIVGKKPSSGLYIYKIVSNGRAQSGKLFVSEN